MTIENFENSVKNLENKGVILNEIIIVTNDFHEYRAARIAAKNGIAAYPFPAKTPWNGYLPFAVREVFAIGYQVYLGRNNLRN
ncbi:MAG: YdcF family protein [Clostridia bacterium]|nr:YdcF family protein [Clostridia bacterium]